MTIDQIIHTEAVRRKEFPVVAERIFLAHAGVAPLPRVAADAMREFCDHGVVNAQENPWSWGKVLSARASAAALISCTPEEIALLGPTSLGVSLVANGIPWDAGDQVLYYRDDYPANVYPWTNLVERGVEPVSLTPRHHGVITWDLIEAALTPRTRLVALASCNFLTGYRIDVDTIGKNLRSRGILFSLDAIQTLGAFPVSVEHVDFLSADSHKWLLGPAAAGIFYVKRSRFEELRPSLLGSWNVVSPQFVAQDNIQFEDTARRYEPGMLNLPGIIGMGASMDLLRKLNISDIAKRLILLHDALLEILKKIGFRPYTDEDQLCDLPDAVWKSGIVTVTHPKADIKELARTLDSKGVVVSYRQDRAGTPVIRFSPHFYNTEEEFERVAAILANV
ncbi:MAG: aminotransferase class V-fold PLP-dependent enzyme [Candidatus Hydrogenedentes bacterium]|nr:aminotransferase class V-fold PLP-dependent enzyme [Candidatus Hydrogenedentota bacterium]